MHVKILQKNDFVEKVQIWRCFIHVSTYYDEIVDSLTSIDKFSSLGDLMVTHRTALREVPSSISGSVKGLIMFAFLFCCCSVLTFMSKTHYLS